MLYESNHAKLRLVPPYFVCDRISIAEALTVSAVGTPNASMIK
jgi:hypothetical protein